MNASDTLLSIYREADAALAAAGCECRACGRCCDFAANDYVLYASLLESDLVIDKAGRRPELIAGRCCFQDALGRCTIHAWRPLGCRTFFCKTACRGIPE